MTRNIPIDESKPGASRFWQMKFKEAEREPRDPDQPRREERHNWR